LKKGKQKIIGRIIKDNKLLKQIDKKISVNYKIKDLYKDGVNSFILLNYQLNLYNLIISLFSFFN